MGVYVKGTEMPERCSACRFAGYGGRFCELHVCMFTGESQPTLSQDRMRNCPLVPAPPHGRLIDADALHIQLIDKELDQLQPWTSFDDYREVLQMIDDAPTIIETSPYRYKMTGKTDKPYGIYFAESEEEE